MPKIIEAELRVYWKQDMPVHEIAGLFSVRPAAVYRASRRLSLPKRHLPNPGRTGRDRGLASEDVAPEQPDTEAGKLARRLAQARRSGKILIPPGWSLERDVDVRVSAGQYAALRVLADQWDMTFARVLARWHTVRVV